MKNKKQVFIDMDGVLVDTIHHICKQIGIDISKWQRGVYSIYDATGIPAQDFFKDVDWANLPKTNLADDLIYYCWEHFPNNCFILTSALPGAYDDKVSWIINHYPFIPESSIIFTWKKYLLAAPNRLLIDDCESVAEDWLKQGGDVIIVPQPWNWSNTNITKGVRDFEIRNI